MKDFALTVSAEAEKGFYPTPPDVADKLLDGIDWYMVRDVLEPSAGSGNLVRSALKKYRIHGRRSYNDSKIDVDCVEIDPHLRAVLQYEFCGDRADELKEQRRILEKKKDYIPEIREYGKLTERESEQLADIIGDLELLNRGRVHIVHDDFLTFDSFKRYNLIVMNPPFSNGDEHLLKAIQMQKKGGGEIRCILNAETIRNPYTNRRKLLIRELENLGAKITFHESMFSSGERPTNVEIAIIKVSIPEEEQESTIFERLKKAAKVDEPDSDVTEMTVSDFLGQIVSLYKVECAAGIELIQEYDAMKPYIMDSFEKKEYSYYPTLTLCVGEPGRLTRGQTPSVNEYLRLVRLKYWNALFSNKEFVGKLTSNLREKYMEKVGSLCDYDFTIFNIQQIATEMNAEMGKGIEDTIVALFDKLTEQHSWYPETTKNVHYYNGWKTNKVHKINSKVIIPIYGMFSSYSWSKEAFNVYEAEKTIGDIEKVFEYLDGNMTAPVDLHGVLLRACEEGRTKNIPCKFFDITLYKKGTMHIKFRNQDLVDRFNIYCCRKKNWLPPNYGKTGYANMTAEEKSVVDGFHGDGSAGAGEAAYAQVIKRSVYFLSEPTKETPMLISAT